MELQSGAKIAAHEGFLGTKYLYTDSKGVNILFWIYLFPQVKIEADVLLCKIFSNVLEILPQLAKTKLFTGKVALRLLKNVITDKAFNSSLVFWPHTRVFFKENVRYLVWTRW